MKATGTPRLSPVIPARDEEAFLPRLLDDVAAAARRLPPSHGGVQVVVVVRYLRALRRRARRRRPRQRLVRGLDGGRVRAVVSARKFERYGEWHFLRDLVLCGVWSLMAPGRLERHADDYWYEGSR